MTIQRNTASQEIGRYTYDAGGRRVRRNTSGIETWYVHGLDGELIAEYAASQPPTNPLTEYGYRNGEMLVTASAPAATQSATFAFTSTRDGQREIYQMNADGTGLLRLTDNAATDDHADYSPDSQRLAFTSWRDGQEEIYVMNADGTNLVRVTNHAASDINAAWSPDGTRLVFASDRDGDHEIYTVNPDGTNLTQLTFNTSFDARPDWGSNNQIAFRSDRDGNAEIYTMNSDGSNQVNRTNNPAIDAAPVWSADGSQVAFVSQRDGNNEIYVMTADGTNAVNRTNNPASDASPDWSGDGVSIGWMTTRDGQHEIYRMNPDGSNVVRLTNHVAQETMPVWRPVVGGGSSGGGVRWLVTDQLGTPRMTIDQTGSLASVRRHDYAPFGEELFAGTGGRTTAQGYQPDNIRQQFTGHERDGETGLDFMQARYFTNVQGRFISRDSFGGFLDNPQTLNLYAYVQNNPVNFSDPTGHLAIGPNNIGRFFNILDYILGRRDDGELYASQEGQEQRSPPPPQEDSPPPGVDVGGCGTIDNPCFGGTVTIFERPPWHQRSILRHVGNWATGVADRATLGWTRWYDAERGIGREEDSAAYLNGMGSGDVFVALITRGRNRVQPVPGATGARTTLRYDSAGRITAYTTFRPNPYPQYPRDWIVHKRFDSSGRPHNGIPTPHVHIRGGVRPARANEIPR